MGRRKRRSIRIPGYDYSQPGVYFVTVCSDNKRIILGKVREGHVHPTALGELVRSRGMKISHHHQGVQSRRNTSMEKDL